MKRKVSLVLAMVLCLSLMCCAQSMADGVNYTTTLTVELFDRGASMTDEYGTLTDNQWIRYAQENFGDPNGIKLEYYPVPRSEEVSKLNTLMASNTAPDIVFTYDESVYFNYARQGGLYDISEIVNTYGENLVNNLSMDYGTLDGARYALYGYRVDIGINSLFIRKDWLDKIGYELQADDEGLYHMSIDDLTDVLYKFKELDPDGTGSTVYPLSIAGADANMERLVQIFEAFYDFNNIDAKTMACLPEFQWAGYNDAMTWLNKLYNDGIIAPDFVTMTGTNRDESLIAGKTGVVIDVAWWGTGLNGPVQTLYDDKADAEIVAFQLDNKYGEVKHYSYPPTGVIFMVPATTPENEAIAAIKYLNWLADFNVAYYYKYGVEGEHFQYVDGLPITIDEEYNSKTKVNTGDINMIYNGDPKNGIKMTIVALPENTQSIRSDAYYLSIRGAYTDYTWGQPLESESQYATNLDSKLSELRAATIMSAVDNLSDTIANYSNSYLSSGGQEVIDEKTALYDAMN